MNQRGRMLLKSVINASHVHGTLIVPVNSASAAPRYFVRHSVEGVVQCFAHSNMRDVLKQDAFLPLHHLYLGNLRITGNIA